MKSNIQPDTGGIARFGALVLIVVACVAAIPVASASTTTVEVDEPSLIVMLEPDGDAELVLTLTYDLADEDEREAFESLREDETAQKAALDRFTSRMHSLVDDASARSNREMDVSNPEISLKTSDDGGTGIVQLSVYWHELAAVDGTELRVTEPFASGFSTDRQLSVVWPEEFSLVEVTYPGAESTETSVESTETSVESTETSVESTETSVTWAPGTDLDGLSLTVEQQDTTETGPVSAEQPGFGLLVALLALLLCTVLATRGVPYLQTRR